VIRVGRLYVGYRALIVALPLLAGVLALGLRLAHGRGTLHVYVAPSSVIGADDLEGLSSRPPAMFDEVPCEASDQALQEQADQARSLRVRQTGSGAGSGVQRGP
jgi:hypothetical protein